MGEMYLGMEQYDKAATEARKLLQSDPRYAPAHVLLGDALSLQGKCAEAKLAYQEAVSSRRSWWRWSRRRSRLAVRERARACALPLPRSTLPRPPGY